MRIFFLTQQNLSTRGRSQRKIQGGKLIDIGLYGIHINALSIFQTRVCQKEGQCSGATPRSASGSR